MGRCVPWHYPPAGELPAPALVCCAVSAAAAGMSSIAAAAFGASAREADGGCSGPSSCRFRSMASASSCGPNGTGQDGWREGLGEQIYFRREQTFVA